MEPKGAAGLEGATPFSGAYSNIPDEVVRPASPALSGLLMCLRMPRFLLTARAVRSKRRNHLSTSFRPRAGPRWVVSTTEWVCAFVWMRTWERWRLLGGWGDASSPPARSSVASIRSPISTARKDLLHQSNTVPIRKRAECRAAAQDLCSPGNLPPLFLQCVWCCLLYLIPTS